MTDDEMREKFPGIKFLHCHQLSKRIGWGVEWKGLRNAWLFDDTPESRAAARDKAVAWLTLLADELN